MRISRHRSLAKEAKEIERRLDLNPLAALEVEPDTAERMGAFLERAVGLEDIEMCEPGALDWFFDTGPEGGLDHRGGGRRSGGGHGDA
jgi:hypothetical protein